MNIQVEDRPQELLEQALLDGHALNVLQIISRGSTLSQREMAERAGISVGLVNLTVKRLVQTGYLQVAALNSSRRAEYSPTPKGLSELTARSYQYLVKTLRTYRQFCGQAEKLIQTLVAQGHRRFVVIGDGEIAGLILVTLREMGDSSIEWHHEPHRDDRPAREGETLLDCRTRYKGNSPGISVLARLLEGPKS